MLTTYQLFAIIEFLMLLFNSFAITISHEIISIKNKSANIAIVNGVEFELYFNDAIIHFCICIVW